MFHASSSSLLFIKRKFFIGGTLLLIFTAFFSFFAASIHAQSPTRGQKEQLAALAIQLRTLQELFNNLKGSLSPNVAVAQTPPTTVTFDNPVPPGSSDSFLNGIFNGINWGTDQWRWSGPYSADSTNSTYFGSDVQFRSFTFAPAPRVLQSMRVYASQNNGTLTLTDNLGQTRTQAITTGSMQLVSTNWTQPSTSITVTFSAGWNLGIDDITYSDVSVPDTTPPSIPTNLAATVISSTQINLSWTASTDNVGGSGVTGYRVERCQGMACTAFVQIAAPSTNSHSDTGLTANTTYRYQVRAVDGAGLFSNYSSIINATTQPASLPDSTNPTVSLTAPLPNATVSGSLVPVSATATDPIVAGQTTSGVAGVQFLLDGLNLGAEDTISPYSINWNTTTASNGSHTLTARARDVAGNLATSAGVTVTVSNSGTAPGSIAFMQNNANDYDRGVQTTIPSGFGDGEFTFELWIRPDATYPVGPTTHGTPGQLTNWSSADPQPYSRSDWWYEGNFLLDGHNNSGTFSNGTFSLQFYGGGRLRWLFGDGVNPGLGGIWAVQAYPATAAPSLLDGAWHQVTLVRRWTGVSNAQLELWIDGQLRDTEISTARTDMRTYWNTWSGFPAGQAGWFWGAEKQAAIGVLSQYEDHKGLLDEIRFWSRAKTSAEISANFAAPVVGNESGLVGLLPFREGNGTSVCNTIVPSQCIALQNMKTGFWSLQDAPLSGGGPVDSTAPTVSLTAPLPNATVSGSLVPVSATATDPIVAGQTTSGVAGVQFLLDGLNLGAEDTISPYSINWNTTTASNGSHTLTARARDVAGNSTISSPISVTVSNTAPSSGLVTSYAFNEGIGITTGDSSGNNQTGALSNTSWTTLGRYGQALSFNGTNSWVTVNDSNPLDLTTAMTVEAWVFPTATLNGWRTIAVKEGINPFVSYYLYASSAPSNQPANGVMINGAENALQAGSPPVLNTWTHLAATYDGTTQRLYANGIQIGSQPQTGSIQTTANPLRIGGNGLWGEYFTGRIDEVRIYNRALTQPEIQTDMSTPVQ